MFLDIIVVHLFSVLPVTPLCDFITRYYSILPLKDVWIFFLFSTMVKMLLQTFLVHVF